MAWVALARLGGRAGTGVHVTAAKLVKSRENELSSLKVDVYGVA